MKKKIFFSEGLQNYLAFVLTGRIYWISKDGSDKKLNRGVIQECYKKNKKSAYFRIYFYSKAD